MTSTEEPLTLEGLSQKVKIACEWGAPYNEDFEDADGWTVTLTYQRRSMTLPFYMGRGHKGEEPTASAVLDCLLSDADAEDQDFEDWARELGYDPDSRKAEAIYRACVKNAKRARRLLGADFEAFWSAER